MRRACRRWLARRHVTVILNGAVVIRGLGRRREDLALGCGAFWQAYVQLTEAELAFRIQKSDLRIRPIWHQKEDRVLAHLLVCFLAYVLWKTLAQMSLAAGLGAEPRRLFAELGELRMMDVVLPTSAGIELRRRCISRPNEHQAILLDRVSE